MTDPLLIERCREMRKNPTRAEKLLWECLRKKQLDGYKFRRQHPILGFVVDFYCHELRLAIELDGSVHLISDQAELDTYRSQALQDEGVFVLRFWNSEVINNVENVLEEIRKKAAVIKLSFKVDR